MQAGFTVTCHLARESSKRWRHIVREEMDNAGAVELLMPALQAAELWQESRPLVYISDRN